MTDLETADGVTIVRFDNPPVNALDLDLLEVIIASMRSVEGPVVSEEELEVVGDNKVVVYDARDLADSENGMKFLYAGDKYDLVARERLSPPRDGTDPPVVAKSEEPEPQTPQACDSE